MVNSEKSGLWFARVINFVEGGKFTIRWFEEDIGDKYHMKLKESRNFLKIYKIFDTQEGIHQHINSFICKVDMVSMRKIHPNKNIPDGVYCLNLADFSIPAREKVALVGIP